MTTLSIRELDDGELEFVLGEQRVSEWLLTRDRKLLNELPAGSPQFVEELERLIPLRILETLESLPDGRLVLDTASAWPWEVCFWKRFACSRKGPDRPPAVPREDVAFRAAALGSGRFASTAALFGGDFALVHVAVDDLELPAEVRLAPALVVLEKPSLAHAERLLVAGVQCVVLGGDEEFYTAFWSGLSVAEACRRARSICVGNADLKLDELKPYAVRSSSARTTVSGFEKPALVLTVTGGPDEGREIPIFARALASGRPVAVGRSGLKRCDVELDDPDLDNLTFRLELHGQRFHLVNVTGTPGKVKVNGLAVVSGVDLNPGDRVDLGTSELLIGTPGEAPRHSAPQASGRFMVEVLAGVPEDVGARFSLEDPVAMVGRLEECPVRLHDRGVSRRHATILQRGPEFYLSPVGDAQVILNGVLLEQESALAHDDRIELTAKTMLRFLDQRRSG